MDLSAEISKWKNETSQEKQWHHDISWLEVLPAHHVLGRPCSHWGTGVLFGGWLSWHTWLDIWQPGEQGPNKTRSKTGWETSLKTYKKPHSGFLEMMTYHLFGLSTTPTAPQVLREAKPEVVDRPFCVVGCLFGDDQERWGEELLLSWLVPLD